MGRAAICVVAVLLSCSSRGGATDGGGTGGGGGTAGGAGTGGGAGTAGGSPSVAPYSADSPWNTPIADGAALDPDSALYVAYLTQNTDQNLLTSDPTQYSFPVFIADSSTPVRRVRFN